MIARLAASFLAAWALLPALTAAQGYPSKPVKIIVPAQPGGGLDLTGRTIGGELGRALGQSFIIENVGGAGGSIAAMATKRAAPDGYTLMVGYVGTHGTNPAVRKLEYDAVRDFTPIAMVGGTPNILVVAPSVPARPTSCCARRRCRLRTSRPSWTTRRRIRPSSTGAPAASAF